MARLSLWLVEMDDGEGTYSEDVGSFNSERDARAFYERMKKVYPAKRIGLWHRPTPHEEWDEDRHLVDSHNY